MLRKITQNNIVCLISVMVFLFCLVFCFFGKDKEKILYGTRRKQDNNNKKIDRKIFDDKISKNLMKKFTDNFDKEYILEEASGIDSSKNDNWWVNSGAFLYSENGTGRTIFGELEKGSKWQKEYEDYNSKETDKGRHPQNIFRLVTKNKWKNFRQECHYKIKRYILSKAKERSESNGILLFNRYQDGNNLYYTGLRVDGAVVIKKKYKGKYYLMGYKKILKGKYDKKKNPNLIPENLWIGVKSEVETINDNQVRIKVFIDMSKSGEWEEILNVVDNGKKYGGKAILKEGYAGIRTDFMDVEFDDYKIEKKK